MTADSRANFTRILVFLLIVLLSSSTTLAVTAESPTMAALNEEEQQLALLSKKGFQGPVVAVLYEGDKPTDSVRHDVQSLRDVAANCGLALFEQDGVSVIGPAKRSDFTDLFSDHPLPATPLSLLGSLDGSQVRALGSREGLPWTGLTRDQQAALCTIFAPGNVVRGNEDASEEHAGNAILAEALPLESSRLIAWLDLTELSVHFPDGSWHSEPLYRTEAPGLSLAPVDDREKSPVTAVPNTLKKSDLDYSQDRLRTPVSLNGRVSLRDFVDLIARETGMNLYAAPGSDRVGLYISASNVPAGRLLRAVSLATTGAWRRFGDAYLFTVDLAGIGQISAREVESEGQFWEEWATLAFKASSLSRNAARAGAIPFATDSQFVPTPAQIAILLPEHGEGGWLPWSSLTPEQMAFTQEKLVEARRDESEAPPAERASWTVHLSAMMRMAVLFPGMQRLTLPDSEVDVDAPASANTADDWRVVRANAPINLRIPLDRPTRGYVCKASSRVKPDDLVAVLLKHGFNTLYLRVFTDGYTAFPSSEFPVIPGLSAGYLRGIISSAHEKGIKVFGVADVLRWSDGSKRHWVSRKTDFLDYDIFGRTHAQFARERAARVAGWPDDMAAACDGLMVAEYGEGVTGDAVSPYSPEVAAKLRTLVREIAGYEFDGIMLDYTTMRHVVPDWDISAAYRASRPGHGVRARLEFFQLHGADSVDVSAEDVDWSDFPLRPLVAACTDLRAPWEEFYRKGCDDLLENLVKTWQEARHSAPVWVLVTFRAGRESHDWLRFKDLVDAVVLSGKDFPGTHGRYYGLKAIPIVRAAGGIGTLRFASILAGGLGRDFEDMTDDYKRDEPWESDAVLIDMTCAGTKRSDYLRLIVPPKTP